jgi:peptidoglycan/LPS O-acetylase OafA/YrhL
VDYVLAVATIFLLIGIISIEGNADVRRPWARSSQTLARFSYTLYVTHMPILLFLTALIEGENIWPRIPRTLCLSFAVLLVSFVYAYGIACLTEFRTDSVRRRVENGLGLRL